MSKAQAAMEFLMTYGWVIMIVLAAAGALAYLGVLSSTGFAALLPERCTFGAGTDCIERPSISATTVSVTLRNNLGNDITFALKQRPRAQEKDTCKEWEAGIDTIVKKSTGETETFEGMDGSSPDIATVDDTGTVTFTLTCADAMRPGRFKANPTFTYTSVETGASHQLSGEILGTIR
ncbi:MAG: hypothetical protein V1735_07785 [Nanoarchaeota archaeon]